MFEKDHLTSREKVIQAIRSGVASKPPRGELCINDNIIRPGASPSGFEHRYRFACSLGLDIYTLTPVCLSHKNQLPDSREFSWPDLKRWVKETPLFTFALLDAAFEWGMKLMGFQKFLAMPQSEPDNLRNFVSRVEHLNMSVLTQLATSGVDGIILADDVAYDRGLLINPKTLRDFFFPSLFRQVKWIKKLGLPIFFHCDGNYTAILSDLIDAGFDGIHCLERDAGMDLRSLQEKTANKLCLWGHLDSKELEKAKDPDYLKRVVSFIKIACQGKKFILGTSSGLYRGMDIATLRAIYLNF